MNRLLSIAFALAACKGKHAVHDDAAPPPPPPRDAASIDAPAAWTELADLPQVEAVRTVALPIDRARPRGDAYGPIAAFDVAVVSSPQLGFVAVDYRTGTIAWKKPGGEHVAPPVAVADGFVLISDCARSETAPNGELVLGCLRVVSATGADRSYVVVHGKAAVDDSPNRVWAIDAHTIRWRNLVVDIITGAATATAATDPPLVVHYKHKTWDITRTADGKIAANGTPPWRTERSYTTLLGAVYLPEQSPMVRLSNRGHYGGAPELLLFDIDATGSLHGQVARPVPGTELAAHAIDAVGDVALAVHLDDDRDFIAGYAANALLMWVYALPPKHHALGVAIAPDAVVVFCDGDTLHILPELSAPPTAPGAARVPSENPTP